MSLASFFIELRRRRVFRMMAWYIIAGWVVVQVASEALPALDLDDRIIRYVWLAMLGGFPIAVVFSWRYDVTSQGIRRTAVGVETDPHGLPAAYDPRRAVDSRRIPAVA